MVRIIYHKWKISRNTLRAYLGKKNEYRYNLSINDLTNQMYESLMKKLIYQRLKEKTLVLQTTQSVIILWELL
ncbi:MAG: hypothetical protein ACFFDN_50960 [Candidatus Hodarchaeota archaeon]